MVNFLTFFGGGEEFLSFLPSFWFWVARNGDFLSDADGDYDDDDKNDHDH